MTLVSSGLQLQLLICSISAFTHNYLDNSLTIPTALVPVQVLNRFDPCCLQTPPPPPLFPPPPSVWRHHIALSRVNTCFAPSLSGWHRSHSNADEDEAAFPEYVVGEQGQGNDEDQITHNCPPGPPGPLGPSGPQGLPGLMGPKGDKGDIGRPGSKGRTGRPGYPGKPGPGGLPGPEGPKGHKGDVGLMGMPGPRGPPGIKGLPGYKGEKGSHGEPGHPGLKGEKGIDGYSGILGPKGEMGVKGERGVSGKRGPTGRPGKRGKQGPKGETGVIGLMGPSGPQGPTGHPGPPGIPASGLYMVGEKGEKGMQGPPGECDCNTFDTNGPGSAALQRRDKNRVSAIFVVSSEKELSNLHMDNAIAFRKDQKSLYFKDADGWQPIQLLPLKMKEREKRDVGLCGDGVLQSLNKEECDDGNLVVTDDCVGCKKAYCGDGYRHDGVEECDGRDFGYETCKSYLPGTFGQLRCTTSCRIDSAGCKHIT